MLGRKLKQHLLRINIHLNFEVCLPKEDYEEWNRNCASMLLYCLLVFCSAKAIT